MTDKTIENNLHHCKYYVIRKKRYCKMTVKLGEEYCGEHQKLNTNLDTDLTNEMEKNKTLKIRVVCPLDRKQLSLLAHINCLYLFGVLFSVRVMLII